MTDRGRTAHHRTPPHTTAHHRTPSHTTPHHALPRDGPSTGPQTGVWYFENQSLAAQEGSLAHKEHTAAPVRSSLRVALTSGFGTIAFASLIVSACEALKRAARRSESGNGLVGCLIACCLMCILSYIEFLTRFALTYSALTGDALCTSGRTFLDHCTRHGFVKVIVVDYLAAITLNFGALGNGPRAEPRAPQARKHEPACTGQQARAM